MFHKSIPTVSEDFLGAIGIHPFFDFGFYMCKKNLRDGDLNSIFIQ